LYFVTASVTCVPSHTSHVPIDESHRARHRSAATTSSRGAHARRRVLQRARPTGATPPTHEVPPSDRRSPMRLRSPQRSRCQSELTSFVLSTQTDTPTGRRTADRRSASARTRRIDLPTEQRPTAGGTGHEQRSPGDCLNIPLKRSGTASPKCRYGTPISRARDPQFVDATGRTGRFGYMKWLSSSRGTCLGAASSTRQMTLLYMCAGFE